MHKLPDIVTPLNDAFPFFFKSSPDDNVLSIYVIFFLSIGIVVNFIPVFECFSLSRARCDEGLRLCKLTRYNDFTGMLQWLHIKEHSENLTYHFIY